MPWWKSHNSRSSSSSPSSSPKKSYRKDLVSFFSHGRESSASVGPKLTRQRKLRYLTDAEVSGSAGSTPASRSPSRRESTSSSPPPPQPLPLPEVSGRTPSPGEGEEEEECSSSASFGASGRVSPPVRFSYKNANRSSDHIEAPSNKSMSTNYRKVIRYPNSVENGNFRPSIPAKSAPTSTFSSLALSPRRSSNADYMPSHYSPGPRMWSAPELLSNEALTSSFTRTSPDVILHSPNRFSLHSSAKKSAGTRSRNTSAPASPLHPKLYPDSYSTWHESNGNGNVHPLPLPPGAEVPSQSSFTRSNTVKPEESPWQKQKLIGNGTFGNVYVATNRHTGALCAMREVNIIPDDPKSVECLKQLNSRSPYFYFELLKSKGLDALSFRSSLHVAMQHYKVQDKDIYRWIHHMTTYVALTCPVYEAWVGMDVVGHITMQHGNLFKVQHRRRVRRGSSGSQSTPLY